MILDETVLCLQAGEVGRTWQLVVSLPVIMPRPSRPWLHSVAYHPFTLPRLVVV